MSKYDEKHKYMYGATVFVTNINHKNAISILVNTASETSCHLIKRFIKRVHEIAIKKAFDEL